MAGAHDSIDKLIAQNESGASSSNAKSAPKAKMNSLNEHSSVEKYQKGDKIKKKDPYGRRKVSDATKRLNKLKRMTDKRAKRQRMLNQIEEFKDEASRIIPRPGPGRAFPFKGKLAGKMQGKARLKDRPGETGYDKDTGYKYKTPKHFKRKYEESLKKKKKGPKGKGNLA